MKGVIAILCMMLTPHARAGKVEMMGDRFRLDELQKVFFATPQFGDQFWWASKRLARERGVEIIHTVMARSHSWKDETGMIFSPLVVLLPRGPALSRLITYLYSREEAERVWANEYITEFEMSDTEEGAKKYSKDKEGGPIPSLHSTPDWTRSPAP